MNYTLNYEEPVMPGLVRVRGITVFVHLVRDVHSLF